MGEGKKVKSFFVPPPNLFAVPYFIVSHEAIVDRILWIPGLTCFGCSVDHRQPFDRRREYKKRGSVEKQIFTQSGLQHIDSSVATF